MQEESDETKKKNDRESIDDGLRRANFVCSPDTCRSNAMNDRAVAAPMVCKNPAIGETKQEGVDIEATGICARFL